MNKKSYKKVALDYAKNVVSGKIIAGKEVVEGCQRFIDDLKRDDLELKTKDADFVIKTIQGMIVHKQGQTLDGLPLANKPFLLSDWQIFIVYNLLGFYWKNTIERRFKEAFIFVPRKNGKTSFIGGLAFALALLERRSGSTLYIAAGSQKQAKQSFEFILYSLKYQGLIDEFRVLNNNAELSLSYQFYDKDGKPDGSIHIEALASNVEKQDSLNCNIAIADEMHCFTKPAQYNRFKEAQKAYTNKLMIGITTAGDDVNSFCYGRLEYGLKVVSGLVKNDSLFCFISRADTNEKGEVDYTNPVQHQKANPNYNITIRPQQMLDDALEAENDAQMRKDFLSRSLNIYTSAVNAWFDVEEFKLSDGQYDWTLEDLAKLPINGMAALTCQGYMI